MSQVVPPLSEAILLGSTMKKVRPYDLDCCAIGMGANAMGFPDSHCDPSDPWNLERRRKIEAAWPWLIKNHYEKWNYIAEVFNEEVCPWDKNQSATKTLEQLVDEIREMEPKCACHRFDCDCPSESESAMAPTTTPSATELPERACEEVRSL